jgi:TonB family protein
MRIRVFAVFYLAVSTAVCAVRCPDEYAELLEAGEYMDLIAATVSQYDYPADLIIRMKANWPLAPREMGLQDSVLLLLYIDESGDVLRAIPAAGKRKTHPDFESAAIEAAMKYKYKPAILNDKEVGIWHPIEIVFYIEGR